MDIIHVSAELAPVAKVGGLGDVLFGLCRAQKEAGHQVTVYLPKYDCLITDEIQNFEVHTPDFLSYFDDQWHHNRIWKGIINEFPVYFFETFDPKGFFDRNTIYGCPDDPDRFLYFNRLVLEYIHKMQLLPHILHVHDWHAAAIPFLQKALFDKPNKPKCVFTIHNLAYQGHTQFSSLEKIGVPSFWFIEGQETWNLLEQGITYADHVTTVSPTYAQEILTPEGGKGLDQHLNAYKNKLSGILNGIDDQFWNPKTDPMLSHHYDSHGFTLNHPPFIENKEKMQKLIRHLFFLEQKKTPLIGCITRLVPQKSPELIKHALLWTLENNGQFALLASASDEKTHREFYGLKRQLAENRNVHIELSYNEKLSHLLYAGADILLVPSLFEPCGLTQLIAMRYGTIPLVRKTGGLADTVFEKENGFVFGPYSKEALDEGLKRTFYTWHHTPEKWRLMMQKGMNMDFSWKKPAHEYLDLYQKLTPSTLYT